MILWCNNLIYMQFSLCRSPAVCEESVNIRKSSWRVIDNGIHDGIVELNFVNMFEALDHTCVDFLILPVFGNCKKIDFGRFNENSTKIIKVKCRLTLQSANRQTLVDQLLGDLDLMPLVQCQRSINAGIRGIIYRITRVKSRCAWKIKVENEDL